jgi:hypothetical protein
MIRMLEDSRVESITSGCGFAMPSNHVSAYYADFIYVTITEDKTN